MNILDSYNCDSETLDNLLHRFVGVGDHVDLPDGIYANRNDTVAAVVFRGKFIAEMQIYDEYGESLCS